MRIFITDKKVADFLLVILLLFWVGIIFLPNHALSATSPPSNPGFTPTPTMDCTQNPGSKNPDGSVNQIYVDNCNTGISTCKDVTPQGQYSQAQFATCWFAYMAKDPYMFGPARRTDCTRLVDNSSSGNWVNTVRSYYVPYAVAGLAGGAILDYFASASDNVAEMQTVCHQCDDGADGCWAKDGGSTQIQYTNCMTNCTFRQLKALSNAGATQTLLHHLGFGNLTVQMVLQIAVVYLIVAIPVALVWVGWAIAYAASYILKLSSDIFLNIQITRDAALQNSWAVVRDWADLLIVVGIIMVAMATILNLERYKAQKFLPGLLLVALLVNFSGVFVGFMVDVSNIATRQFLVGSNDGGESNILTALNGNYDAIANDVVTLAHNEKKGIGQVLGQAYLYAIGYGNLAFIYLAVGVAYLYAAVLLLARYALLSFLFVVSPLAFVFFVFPIEKARGLWTQWWSNFIKWCFVGVGSGFAIYLAGAVLSTSGWTKNITIDFTKTLTFTDVIREIFQGYTPVFVALMFLYIGNRSAVKVAGGIAAAIVSAIATGGASIMGSVGKSAASLTMKGAHKIPGLGKLTKGIENKVRQTPAGFNYYRNKIKEMAGTAPHGTAMKEWRATQSKRLDKHRDAYKELTKTHEGQERLTKIAKTGRAEESAAAVEALSTVKGGLEKLGTDRERLIKNSIGFGVEAKELVKNPDDAHLDEEAVNAIERRDGVSRGEAINRHRRKLYENYRVEGIEDKNDAEVLEKISKKAPDKMDAEGAYYLEEAVKRGIVDHIPETEATIKERFKRTKTNFGSRAIERIKRSHPHFATIDETAVRTRQEKLAREDLDNRSIFRKATEAEIVAQRSNAEREVIADAYRHANTRDLSRKAIESPEFYEHIMKNKDTKAAKRVLDSLPVAQADAVARSSFGRELAKIKPANQSTLSEIKNSKGVLAALNKQIQDNKDEQDKEMKKPMAVMGPALRQLKQKEAELREQANRAQEHQKRLATQIKERMEKLKLYQIYRNKP